MTDHLSTVVDRLTSTCRAAAARAANLCVIRQHEAIGLEHLWASVLDSPSSDAARAMRQAGIDIADVKRDLDRTLSRNRCRGSGTPVFSEELSSLLHRAAELVSRDAKVGSGELLMGMTAGDAWRDEVHAFSPTLASASPDAFMRALADLPTEELATESARGVPPAAESALARFTIDLTARASAGRLDPVVGRERETMQLIDVLGRRRQNNPILVGDAGVGKTAVVEGLALAIAGGAVPELLAATRLLVLDLGLMQAGASVKGEFESRLRDVLTEVAASPRPIVIFIDEAHTMVGAGGTAGQNDAANLLKPALARGELRTIGATTWAEYKKYFEKDAALARRFQPVEVKEPEPEIAEAMLRAVIPALEAHAGVRILDEAVTAAVQLSARYVRDRKLPDKAVSLLDTAASRVALSRMTPHPLLARLEGELARARAKCGALTRDALELGGAPNPDLPRGGEIAALEAHLVSRQEAIGRELSALKSPANTQMLSTEPALVPRYVDARVVAEIVADWTGIPVGRVQQDEIAALSDLHRHLARRVAGQDHALEAIAERVRSARAGLGDPRRPTGVFLLVGPSGVGKTETALALAEALTGDERHLITVNMSEYQEAHSVSGLKGAPAGYVGYGEGGTLTESVRRHPYGVLLVDEVEKAHPDVRELFYQVFDRGYMTDAEGRDIDFRNLTILLTSNVGSATVMQACLNRSAADRPTPDVLLENMRPALYQAFAPAFLGRTCMLPYFPLADNVLGHVVGERLRAVATRVKEQHGATLTFDESVVEWIIERCNEADAGARAAIRLLDGSVLTAVTNAVFDRPSTKHVELNLACLADKVVCKWAPPPKQG